MEGTRRYWEALALALVLCAGALVLASPLLLGGAIAIGTWLLVRQYWFARALAATTIALTVTQSTARTGVYTEDALLVRLAATLAQPSPLTIEVAARPPIGARLVDGDTRFELADRRDETTFQVSWPVAGTFAFESPTVRLSDELFAEELSVGDPIRVPVSPRGTERLHVGTGGTPLVTTYGEHEADGFGSGLTPAEVRKYVPGDTIRRIDWKATARRGHPHVREHDAETDRVTLLVVDHRTSMGVGGPGETKLDYVREIALGLLETARASSDPVGLYAIGDRGLTERLEPRSSAEHYATVRDAIEGLVPTEATEATDSAGPAIGPADARRRGHRLDPETPMGRSLAPFMRERTPYRQRIDRDPLFSTVRTHVRRLTGTPLTVLLTDDSRRVELREAVSVARRGDDTVLAFLTPSCLFEPGGLSDLESTFDRYRSFETYRRQLARLDRVSAFELAPGDRLATVLDARRSAQSTHTGNGTGRAASKSLTDRSTVQPASDAPSSGGA